MKYIFKTFLVGFLGLLIASCANPINQATSNQYTDRCFEAESRGNLELAEQACYRALVNVDWGSLGPEQKSQKLYNLARIKRQLAKFSEAEDLLNQSLAIEEELSPRSEVRIGKRCVEQSVNLAAQDRWDEGVKCLDQAIPVAHQFDKEERAFFSLVLSKYGEEFRKQNQIDLAEKFETASASVK